MGDCYTLPQKCLIIHWEAQRLYLISQWVFLCQRTNSIHGGEKSISFHWEFGNCTPSYRPHGDVIICPTSNFPFYIEIIPQRKRNIKFKGSNVVLLGHRQIFLCREQKDDQSWGNFAYSAWNNALFWENIFNQSVQIHKVSHHHDNNLLNPHEPRSLRCVSIPLLYADDPHNVPYALCIA